ncbi:MAG: hypothetical protein M0D55_01720 [Elusimicrobiota bacterium]|nr:MAG: hypothetical protein M0D55_01720 [Elusimicrobiota bacterium]
MPLSPAPSISGAAVNSFQNMPAPFALTAGLGSLHAPSFVTAPLMLTPMAQLALPLGVKAAPVAHGAVPRLVPSALASQLPAPHKPAKSNPSSVIESLREHGSESASVSKLDGEAGKSALELNFLRAASLGGDGNPTSDGSAPAEKTDATPLMARVLERIKLDDRGRPDEKKALEESFRRMLETPTGRRLAEDFLAEGITGTVHFEEFPDSQLYLINGRKKFFAAQAYTHWQADNTVEIKLNRHFVDGDREIMEETLPWVIGHELLGHGLWYGRAAKGNLYTAFHYHENNETLARLVGWSIDRELDGKFEEAGVWNYLDDPAYYLANLKLRLPYYSVTFSQAEMADAMGTLRGRLAAATNEIDRAKRNLAAQQTWTAVIDHFASDHGIAPERFTMLRQEQSDLVAHYTAEVVNSEAVVAEITALLDRMAAEPSQDSQKYLAAAAQTPLFAQLAAETERLRRDLAGDSAKTPREAPREAPPRPKDQISWAELSKMYHDDVAADAKRPAGKKHWQ